MATLDRASFEGAVGCFASERISSGAGHLHEGWLRGPSATRSRGSVLGSEPLRDGIRPLPGKVLSLAQDKEASDIATSPRGFFSRRNA